MRVLVILKATAKGEAGVMPSMEDIQRGISFNEEMLKAGILKSADGIKPSKFGKRVVLRRNSKPSITDGPFAETKELIAGFWIWEVKSMDEALEWAKRAPAPSSEEEANIEIRPFYAGRCRISVRDRAQRDGACKATEDHDELLHDSTRSRNFDGCALDSLLMRLDCRPTLP